jgi:hypothetical protein
MGMTSKDRDGYALCGRRKKSGELCRQFAGAGTDHPGIGKCRWHGGTSPSHNNHAAKVEAQRQMATYGDPVETTPLAALKGVLRLTAGHVAWLKVRIAAMDDLDGPEAAMLTKLYGEERDRLTRVGKACLDSGMKQIELEAAERQTAVMGTFLEAILDELDLTPEQRQQVGPAIRRAIPVVAGSGEADPAPDPVVDAVLV